MDGTGTEYIAWFFNGWNSADVISLLITIGGLVLTYQKAKEAAEIAADTEQKVTAEVHRIESQLSSFELVNIISAAQSVILSVLSDLEARDWSKFRNDIRHLKSLFIKIGDEDDCAIDPFRDQLKQAVKFYQHKIETVDWDDPVKTENSNKISPVVDDHQILVDRMLRAIQKDHVNARQ